MTWAVNWCLLPIKICGSLGWMAVSWVMLAMKVMQLRRSPKEPGSPALIIPAGYFTMVPTNPLVCRTTDVSTMLITKGGRPSLRESINGAVTRPQKVTRILFLGIYSVFIITQIAEKMDLNLGPPSRPKNRPFKLIQKLHLNLALLLLQRQSAARLHNAQPSPPTPAKFG